MYIMSAICDSSPFCYVQISIHFCNTHKQCHRYFQTYFGGSLQIVCKKGSVEELRLWFDKELKPRDCLTTSLTNGSILKSKHSPQFITSPTYDPLVLANSTVEIMTQFNEFEVGCGCQRVQKNL
ncbi:hypothetical protein BDA96_06G032400 [Sorghum bicolor]|uniref:Uncharacterized protein n=2 Tax=Sorghum bicolor TaxID=4558 RepID=A0A921QNT5_SORBI|nr:hypothetical protein BDA96_06G032400 [Sorghum bicolor]OQU81225.1 hypothetical protein SORBI_3006G030001 [Sorghum bicolor]